MSRLEETRAELRAMLPELRRRYPVAGSGVFGSYARGEHTATSDLDLLVDLDGPIGPFAFARLEEEIGRRLDVPVGLATRAALRPVIGERIMRGPLPV